MSAFPYTRITADDWGISPAVNEGILHLVKEGIVSRVSILADAPHIDFQLQELLGQKAELGLHFDLTLADRKKSKNPFHSRNLLPYLKNSRVTAKSKRQSFEQECLRQLTVLDSLGIKVSYVDGHQHVHLLPFVSVGVAKAMHARGIKTTRNPYSAELWFTKKFLINLLSLAGIRNFKKQGIQSFPCLYPQQKAHKSPKSLQSFFQKAPESEFIVHPAVRDDFKEVGCRDPYREGRVIEYRNLLALKEIYA